MVELKVNTKYRVIGLPENVGRIENGDIEKAHDWISRLAKTGGREWCLRAKFLASVFDDD